MEEEVRVAGKMWGEMTAMASNCWQLFIKALFSNGRSKMIYKSRIQQLIKLNSLHFKFYIYTKKVYSLKHLTTLSYY